MTRFWNFVARLWRAGLRAAPLRLWVLFAAGPILTVCAGILVAIVWKGGWPLDLRDKQLSIIGATLFGTLALLAIVFAKIAGMKVSASGPLGTHMEADASETDHSAPPPSPPSTTITVNQSPPPIAPPVVPK